MTEFSGAAFTWDFESAEQAVTFDFELDVAHALAVVPKVVEVGMICKTADIGYSVGDVVIFGASSADLAISDRGMIMLKNVTDITILVGQFIDLINATTKNAAVITVGSWKWIVRAKK